MKTGHWINYNTRLAVEIDEHERWLRAGNNASRLGVPAQVQSSFRDFRAGEDRDRFLTFVLTSAPVMRVRGHGVWWTFEFGSIPTDRPLESIRSFCEDRAGELTSLVINNLTTGEATELRWWEFKERFEGGRILSV